MARNGKNYSSGCRGNNCRRGDGRVTGKRRKPLRIHDARSGGDSPSRCRSAQVGRSSWNRSVQRAYQPLPCMRPINRSAGVSMWQRSRPEPRCRRHVRGGCGRSPPSGAVRSRANVSTRHSKETGDSAIRGGRIACDATAVRPASVSSSISGGASMQVTFIAAAFFSETRFTTNSPVPRMLVAVSLKRPGPAAVRAQASAVVSQHVEEAVRRCIDRRRPRTVSSPRRSAAGSRWPSDIL